MIKAFLQDKNLILQDNVIVSGESQSDTLQVMADLALSQHSFYLNIQNGPKQFKLQMAKQITTDGVVLTLPVGREITVGSELVYLCLEAVLEDQVFRSKRVGLDVLPSVEITDLRSESQSFFDSVIQAIATESQNALDLIDTKAQEAVASVDEGKQDIEASAQSAVTQIESKVQQVTSQVNEATQTITQSAQEVTDSAQAATTAMAQSLSLAQQSATSAAAASASAQSDAAAAQASENQAAQTAQMAQQIQEDLGEFSTLATQVSELASFPNIMFERVEGESLIFPENHYGKVMFDFIQGKCVTTVPDETKPISIDNPATYNCVAEDGNLTLMMDDEPYVVQVPVPMYEFNGEADVLKFRKGRYIIERHFTRWKVDGVYIKAVDTGVREVNGDITLREFNLPKVKVTGGYDVNFCKCTLFAHGQQVGQQRMYFKNSVLHFMMDESYLLKNGTYQDINAFIVEKATTLPFIIILKNKFFTAHGLDSEAVLGSVKIKDGELSVEPLRPRIAAYAANAQIAKWITNQAATVYETI